MSVVDILELLAMAVLWLAGFFGTALVLDKIECRLRSPRTCRVCGGALERSAFPSNRACLIWTLDHVPDPGLVSPCSNCGELHCLKCGQPLMGHQ
jgi:hypothetical protein